MTQESKAEKSPLHFMKYIFHLVAAIVFIYSFSVGGDWQIDTVFQQQTQIFAQIKYLLAAIFFELGAVSFR